MLRVIAILLMLSGVVFAQDNLNDLRSEARRLTLEAKISELPADLQSEATELLRRAQALREPMMTMRAEMLEVYTAELQRGQPVYLARATARNAVVEGRLVLLPELRPLLKDIRTLMSKDEVAGLFKEVRFWRDRPRRY